MKASKMMMLPIGNKLVFQRRYRRKGTRGFSFIEAMVALAILSFGIVMIFKSFLLSLDVIRHLTRRIYARELLHNKSAVMQRLFELEGEIPFSQIKDGEMVMMGSQRLLFQYEINFIPLSNLINIYEVDMLISWDETGRIKRIPSVTYIARYEPVEVK